MRGSVALTGIAVAVLAVIAEPPLGVAQSTAAAPTPPRPTPGTIFVLNSGPSSITSYPVSATGASPPLTTIKGARAALSGATDLAVTPSGAVWVTNPTTNAVSEYAGGASGNVKAIARIAGSKTKLHSPVALAVDRKGDVWVLNDNISDSSASVLEFRAGAVGNVAPTRRIAGAATRLFPAGGIAVTPDGTGIWVTHVEAGSGLNTPGLQRFASSAAGNAAPTVTIAGSRTALDYPSSLVVDRTGALTVASDPDRRKASALLAFAATAAGNVSPTRRIAGGATTLDTPAFIALDALARVWAPNPVSSQLARFGPTASGRVAPTRTIAGKATGLSKPRAIAVLTVAPGVPRNLSVTQIPGQRMQVSWRPPTSTGGGLEGYNLFRRKGTKHRLHRTVLGPVRSVTTGRLARHHHYTFMVRAENNAGASADSVAVVVLVR